MILRLAVICAVFVVGQALTPSSFLSTVDKARLKQLFESSLADESSLAYAILGLKLLGQTAPNAGDLCKKLQAHSEKADVSVEALFTAASAAQALTACSLKLNTQATKVGIVINDVFPS